MKPSADHAPPSRRRDDGWDETVLVWNATVARIPAYVLPDLVVDVPGEKIATRYRDCMPSPGKSKRGGKRR
jgi:hypothetical protein